jgi:hypothetical protein
VQEGLKKVKIQGYHAENRGCSYHATTEVQEELYLDVQEENKESEFKATTLRIEF